LAVLHSGDDDDDGGGDDDDGDDDDDDDGDGASRVRLMSDVMYISL